MLANDIRNYQIMDDYIAHHGILGQKWGVRRFQNPDGTRTAAGKVRYNGNGGKKQGIIDKVMAGAKNAKLNKQRKAALEKARQAKAAKAEYEAEKKKALESGDYKQIQKYANELSTAEIKSALDRADTLARLDQNVAKNTPKQKDVWDTIDDVANKVGTATNAFNRGKDAWNSFANAWNTFADDDSMLPELGTNFAEQKEKKRKEAAEAVRKAQVEEITKTVDPSKVMKNQSLFTDAELKSAKERIGNYEALKLQNQLRTESAEKAIKEAEARAKEQLEKNRKDKIAGLTKKGDISEVLKNKDLFTNDELESASARYESLKAIERKIDDVSPKDLEDIYKYLDDWND